HRRDGTSIRYTGGFTRVKIGALEVAAGPRGHTLLEVAAQADGSIIGIAIIVIAGARPGTVMAVDACCHGDEPEGTLAVLRLAEKLDPKDLSGTVILTTALHVPAFFLMDRGNWCDHWHGDMNRLFPGSAEGNLTQRIAHTYLDEVGR